MLTLVSAVWLAGRGRDAVLASQGDIWDTQWDMLFAQVLFAAVQDGQLRPWSSRAS